MATTNIVQAITFDTDYIYLTIDGQVFKILLEKASMKLKGADEYQRMLFRISPSGYGIHWPLIDEDLAVDELLKSA